MKFKHLLMGLGVAGVVGAAIFVGYNSQMTAGLEPSNPVIEEIVVEEQAVDQPALDEAALEEMLAEMAVADSTTAQMPAEVELDEEASEKIMRIVGALEDLDDVQNVFTNAIYAEGV